MFALIDCNNFYVSCERVFQPHLKNVPVAVLSNNDGCIIARSNEVKNLGVPMGAPIFKYKEIAQFNSIHLCSSNYTLYGDMSSRVVSVIKSFGVKVEVYSIDECFICLEEMDQRQLEEFAVKAQQKILQYTGIPVSIGIAPTKTLCKLANHLAKEKILTLRHLNQRKGICLLPDRKYFQDEFDQLMRLIPVNDLWGIGNKQAFKFRSHGVHTAYALIQKSDAFIRKLTNILVLKLVYELKGIPCLALEEELEDQKSLTCSRSFGQRITTLEQIKEAIVTYATTAAAKLRKRGLKARHVGVFLRNSPHSKTEVFYSNYAHASIVHYTADSMLIIGHATELIEKIYKTGVRYMKCGITLSDLTSAESLNFFEAQNSATKDKLMQAMDQINSKNRSNLVYFAAAGINKPWQMKRQSRSNKFTTCWQEIMAVKA